MNESNNSSSSNYNADEDDMMDDFVFPDDQQAPDKILWSAVARNGTILCEAGQDDHDGLVSRTAQGLLARKATAGYEFHQVGGKWPFRRSNNNNKKNKKGYDDEEQHQPHLRGCKFHVYEHNTEDVEQVRVWVFAAVYDALTVEQLEVQSFLEKIVALTEIYREDDPTWRSGDTLSCQGTFAPILLQRMEEVSYLGKMAMLHEKLQNSKDIMNDNVELLLDREEKIRDQLADKSTKMHEMAAVFQKKSRKVRRLKMMQNAKHGAVLGTAVTAGVAIVVVPPLIAIL